MKTANRRSSDRRRWRSGSALGFLLVGGALTLCGAPSPLGSSLAARAAVVLLKESDEPLMGPIVKDQADRIVIRETLPDGSQRERSIARADVAEVIVTVDPARLAALDPSRPADYLEYAEDLAEKRRDPEALEAALRLYGIAAWLAPERHGRSALLGMAAIARSPEEGRGFRALAYLLDEGRDPQLLRDSDPPGARAKPAATVRTGLTDDGLLEAVRQLRRGARSVARRLAERPETKAEFGRLQGILTYDEFLAGCLDSAPPDTLLRALLQAELALTPVESGESATTGAAAATSSAGAGWSADLLDSPARPLPVLSLGRITEFDPRAHRYVDGRWVAPTP